MKPKGSDGVTASSPKVGRGPLLQTKGWKGARCFTPKGRREPIVANYRVTKGPTASQPKGKTGARYFRQKGRTAPIFANHQTESDPLPQTIGVKG